MAGKDRILILGPTGRLLIEVQLKINVAIKKAGNVKVRYIRVSNETSYGVMEFVHAWKVEELRDFCGLTGNHQVTLTQFVQSVFLLTIFKSSSEPKPYPKWSSLYHQVLNSATFKVLLTEYKVTYNSLASCQVTNVD
ncbi:hypothetical protein JHK84_050369 [Glycine max]|nr:hypothetical protein JHK86_050307 [Glycine max]KAG5094781.1 hypothetical protein JHK84_050369 [Glycine max]